MLFLLLFKSYLLLKLLIKSYATFCAMRQNPVYASFCIKFIIEIVMKVSNNETVGLLLL